MWLAVSEFRQRVNGKQGVMLGTGWMGTERHQMAPAGGNQGGREQRQLLTCWRELQTGFLRWLIKDIWAGLNGTNPVSGQGLD